MTRTYIFPILLIQILGVGCSPKQLPTDAPSLWALAEQGDVRAQASLGWMYDVGLGVEEDDKKAVKWYRKAAEQNHPKSQSNLGAMYANGRGVGKDDKEAVKWFQKAAEQNEINAQFDLGLMYHLGRGVHEDSVMGYAWYNIAATRGDADAKVNLNLITEKMTPEQIAESVALSKELRKKIVTNKSTKK